MTLVAVYETFNFYYSLLSLARARKYKLRAEVAKYKSGAGPSNTNWSWGPGLAEDLCYLLPSNNFFNTI